MTIGCKNMLVSYIDTNEESHFENVTDLNLRSDSNFITFSTISGEIIDYHIIAKDMVRRISMIDTTSNKIGILYQDIKGR